MPEDKVINKVVYGGDTLMDITDTTATEADVVSGKDFYLASGKKSSGTLTVPNVPDWALEENPPTYALSYDENSIGSSYTDTATTIEPNYIPSGDVILESDTVSIPNTVNMTYSYNSYTCTLSINDFNLSGTEYNLPTSAKFHGSGVKFVINSNVNSNAVGTGAADYMEI